MWHTQARRMRKQPDDGKIRVCIADDSSLIFSDDYRLGWPSGFASAGCSVFSVDIAYLRKIPSIRGGPYSTGRMGGIAKDLAKQIVRRDPHLVFVHHGRAAANDLFLGTLRQHGIRTAVYFCDEPYESGWTLHEGSRFDAVFTMEPATIVPHRIASKKPTVFYLPPAVDPSKFTARRYVDRSHSALFLGNGTLPPRPQYLKPVANLIPDAKIHYMRSVGKGHRDWISIDDYPAMYADCTVGLNVHRDPTITQLCYKKYIRGRRQKAIPGLQLCTAPPAKWGTGIWNPYNLPAVHVNPRFFEMAACGTCVVSDDTRAELTRMFPFAPRAKDPQHFLELVQYYLDHRKEAEEIGHACRESILKAHTWAHRAGEILIRTGLMDRRQDELSTYLGPPPAWMTPQDFNERGERSSSEATGRSVRWSPAYGKSMIAASGTSRDPNSTDWRDDW